MRQASGVEVLRGNFMSSAIVKLAGMTDRQLARFDDQLLILRYYENEHLCVEEISSPELIETLAELIEQLPAPMLDTLMRHNSRGEDIVYERSALTELIESGALSFAFVIAGQGAKAFGMPEMFAPAHHLKHHQLLEASSLLITDGRYSGVTKGACIGHVTPEAFVGGGIGSIEDGDILRFSLHQHRLDIIDPQGLVSGRVEPLKELPSRAELVAQRRARMIERMGQIAASNLMSDVTSAETGCIPVAVDQRATRSLPGD